MKVVIKLPKFDIVLKAWSWNGERIDGRGAVVAVREINFIPGLSDCHIMPIQVLLFGIRRIGKE